MSINLQKFQIMMEEVGPEVSDIETVIQNEDRDWAIQFEDQTIVTLEWADNPDKVVLSTILGKPTQKNQLSVYETLLCYNLLWRDTGGVKMALGGPEGEILLIYEMYMQETNLNEFKTVLLNFLNIAKVWEVFIQSEDNSLNETANDSLDILNYST